MAMLKYNKKLIPIAQEMRNEMTKEESKLWYYFLRNYEVKFRRQKVILNFIADFYCAKAKLVVEVDGKQHLSPDNKEYDGIRSKYLSAIDINVIRFSNDEINNNFDIVCSEIDRVVQKLIMKT